MAGRQIKVRRCLALGSCLGPTDIKEMGSYNEIRLTHPRDQPKLNAEKR